MDQQNDSLKAEILNFLRRNFVMAIAVCQDNKPASSVVAYYVDDELNFYFATHTDSFKSRIVRSNPSISLSVWENHYMLIQADGQVSEITELDQRKDLLDKILATTGQDPTFWPPLLKLPGHDYSFFKITPTWLRKLDLQKLSASEGESPFAELQL